MILRNFIRHYWSLFATRHYEWICSKFSLIHLQLSTFTSYSRIYFKLEIPLEKKVIKIVHNPQHSTWTRSLDFSMGKKRQKISRNLSSSPTVWLKSACFKKIFEKFEDFLLVFLCFRGIFWGCSVDKRVLVA